MAEQYMWQTGPKTSAQLWYPRHLSVSARFSFHLVHPSGECRCYISSDMYPTLCMLALILPKGWSMDCRLKPIAGDISRNTSGSMAFYMYWSSIVSWRLSVSMATLAVMAASLQFIQYKCNAAVGHKDRVGEVNAGQKLGSSDKAGGWQLRWRGVAVFKWVVIHPFI